MSALLSGFIWNWSTVQTLLAGMDDFSEGPVTGSIPYLETEMATDVYISQNNYRVI